MQVYVEMSCFGSPILQVISVFFLALEKGLALKTQNYVPSSIIILPRQKVIITRDI